MAASERLFVISDLHLGGAEAAPDQAAFQMCTPAGRAALARFIEWAAAQRTPDCQVQLIVAGDIVDFLAEESDGQFEPFTADDARARAKLERILGDTRVVWDALAAFVAGGNALVLMLGNHDLELSLPGPRRLLMDTLGPGRVEFLYDNQAFARGGVLIEHGNRYDDWNAVPHDDLREVRSRLSRGEAAKFDPPPGSRMVVDIVNPTKKHLAFIDLLKPEDAALLPFLALLAPNRFRLASESLQNRVRALRVRYGPGQQPKDRNYIGYSAGEGAAVGAGTGTGDVDDDRLMRLAEEAAAGGDPGLISAGSEKSFFERWKVRVADAYRDKQLDLLARTLRALRGAEGRMFDLACEAEKYLVAATESAARGFQVIVYGHTHLPKRVSLQGRIAADGTRIAHDAVYLNSGTWADLMALPREVFDEGAPARDQLRAFADDLAANRVDRWRRLVPTFVDITIDAAGKPRADVCLFGEQRTPISMTTERLRDRLRGAPT